MNILPPIKMHPGALPSLDDLGISPSRFAMQPMHQVQAPPCLAPLAVSRTADANPSLSLVAPTRAVVGASQQRALPTVEHASIPRGTEPSEPEYKRPVYARGERSGQPAPAGIVVDGENFVPKGTYRSRIIVHAKGKLAGKHAPPGTVADGINFVPRSTFHGRAVVYATGARAGQTASVGTVADGVRFLSRRTYVNRRIVYAQGERAGRVAPAGAVDDGVLFTRYSKYIYKRCTARLGPHIA